MARECPVGFRFKPTEEELITLLWFKATNQQQHITNVVPEKKLYSVDASPWKIFAEDDVLWELSDDSGKKRTKRVTYVVTKLSKMSPNKVARTAGCGTWEGQSKGQDISNSRGEIIGSMKMLSYVLNSGSPQEGGWIMHEYSLAGSLLDRIGSTDYVVCRITIDDEKHTKVKKVAVAKQGVYQAGSMRSTKKPKVLGKRSEPSFIQQSSNPSKMLRSDVVEEEISINAASNLAMGIGIDGAIETPNSLNNYDEFVISPQAIMSDELIGMDGQTSCRDVSLEDGTQSMNLMGGIGDGFGFDDDIVQYTALLAGILQEDDGLVQVEVSLQHSEQSFGQYQQVDETSDYPYSEIVLVEEVQTRVHDPVDCSAQVIACEGAGKEENLQPVGTLDQATNADQPTEAESSERKFEAPSEQTPPHFDFGDDMITCQAMVDDLFSDEFLPFSGEDDEDIYAQPISVTDEWFQDAMQSDYPHSEIVLVEEAQTQVHDPVDCSAEVIACEGTGKEENLQPVSTLDQATNADQPTEAESSERKFEAPSEQTPPHFDFGDDMITCQAMVDDFFSDEFLPISGEEDEDIYAQPISVTDEWFQDAMQCFGVVHSPGLRR